MTERVRIPDQEYAERIRKAAEAARQKGLDVLLVNSTESDFANVRYFSGFWPLFEVAGVAISPAGEAALLVGPESSAFAEDVSRIRKIFSLIEYRESADPAYPELKVSTFRDVFKSIGVQGDHLKIGIGGYLVTSVALVEGLKAVFPNAQITRADDIMVGLRSIKSKNELACLREAFRIVEIAMQETMKVIRPGVTELELVGTAQKAVYENGAEYEGLPMYIFAEKATRHAISRPSYRVIQKGDIVQLNLSARVDGYSPSVGWPVSVGKLQGRKKEIVEFCLEAHRWTHSQVRAGVTASTIAKNYLSLFESKGFRDAYVYGPCHGLGMIEVEPPWMESISEYQLAPNMTFQVDSFVATHDFGVRWETGIVVTTEGCSPLSKPLGKIYEV
ncbi:MAG: Xaa-Pro peptidase family protein [Spirochaetia bacterium]|jgi:Xaa-Pro aminopeptidase